MEKRQSKQDTDGSRKKSNKAKSDTIGEKKKEKKAAYTPKEFITSEQGVSLLERAEKSVAERAEKIKTKCNGDLEKYYVKYMDMLCKTYTQWIRASPLCGNKRSKAYSSLKAVQAAIKSQAAEEFSAEREVKKVLALGNTSKQNNSSSVQVPVPLDQSFTSQTGTYTEENITQSKEESKYIFDDTINDFILTDY